MSLLQWVRLFPSPGKSHIGLGWCSGHWWLCQWHIAAPSCRPSVPKLGWQDKWLPGEGGVQRRQALKTSVLGTRPSVRDGAEGLKKFSSPLSDGKRRTRKEGAIERSTWDLLVCPCHLCFLPRLCLGVWTVRAGNSVIRVWKLPQAPSSENRDRPEDFSSRPLGEWNQDWSDPTIKEYVLGWYFGRITLYFLQLVTPCQPALWHSWDFISSYSPVARVALVPWGTPVPQQCDQHPHRPRRKREWSDESNLDWNLNVVPTWVLQPNTVVHQVVFSKLHKWKRRVKKLA